MAMLGPNQSVWRAIKRALSIIGSATYGLTLTLVVVAIQLLIGIGVVSALHAMGL